MAQSPPRFEDLPEIVSRDDAASFLGVSIFTLLRMHRDGNIAMFRIGALWKIRKDEIARVINQSHTEYERDGRDD